MSLGLSSVTINAVEYISKVKFDSALQIAYDSGSRIGVATFTIMSAPGSFVVAVNQEVKIYDSGSTLLFLGQVARIEPSAPAGASATTWYKITVRDYATILDQALIPGPVSYGGVSDQFIIQQIVSTYAPALSTTFVDSTATIDAITFENISVRQALENIVKLTGCQFYVDSAKNLQYHSPSGSAAPFSISETPNNTTSFSALFQSLAPVTDFTNATNYVSVIGAISSGGAPSSALAQDSASQSSYGVIKRIIIDRSLQSNAACLARANVEIANYKQPQISGTVVVRRTGLMVGQLLTLSLPSVNVSGSYLIQRVSASWDSQVDVKYTVQYGAYLPNLYSWLRALTTSPPDQPYTPVSTIPSGIISIANFAASVRPVAIVTSLPTLPDTNYPSNSTVVLTSDGLLYRNSSGTWTKVVNTTDLQGTVSAAQIAANAIIAGKIAANAVTAGTIAAGVVTGTVISATANIIQSNIGGSGVTTDISQVFDGTVGFTGLSIYTTAGGSSGARAVLSPVGMVVRNSSGNAGVSLVIASGVGNLSLSTPGGGLSMSSTPSQLLFSSAGAQPLFVVQTSSTPTFWLSNSSGSTRITGGISSDHGYIQFNNTSNYALMTDTLYKKAVGGVGTCSGGFVTISTGLSSIDYAVATAIGSFPGGSSVMYAAAISGGNVTFANDTVAGASFLWEARGNP